MNPSAGPLAVAAARFTAPVFTQIPTSLPTLPRLPEPQVGRNSVVLRGRGDASIFQDDFTERFEGIFQGWFEEVPTG